MNWNPLFSKIILIGHLLHHQSDNQNSSKGVTFVAELWLLEWHQVEHHNYGKRTT